MAMPVTLAEEVEMATAVVLARPLQEAGNRFQVERVLQGNLKAGRVILASSAHNYKGLVLLSTAGSEGSPMWSGRPRPADETTVRFAEAVLRLPDRYAAGGRARRLNFFFDYLGHSQKNLADSAYVEFSDAPYPQVIAFAGKLGAPKLRKWLKDPKTPEEYQSLYYLLLAQVGNSEDRGWLEKRLNEALKRPPSGSLRSLLLCYLLLEKKPGLAWVERNYLKGRIEYRNVALEALRVLMDESTPFPKAALLPIFREQLKDRDLAGLIVRDLAVWEDWDSLPQVLPLLELPSRYQYVRTAAIRYLLTCPLPQAKVELDKLKAKDPSALSGNLQPFLKPKTQGSR
jgi:hypothetical protein